MQTKRLVFSGLIALLGGMTWHASLPAAIGPAEGTSLQGEVPRQPHSAAHKATAQSLRVATFNIHGCKGLDGQRDVDRVARCLQGSNLDFVALNEVHGARLWQKLDQAGELGERLGMAWLFAPNTRCWYHLDSGNGLLSALPVNSWRQIPLEHRTERGYRNAVLLDLQHGDRTIHVVLTHITRHDDASRQEQLRAVIDLYLSLAEPAILLGDLNSNGTDPQIRRLLATRGVCDPVGQILGPKAPPRIDWIVARGLRATDAGICEADASDHPMVWAELE